MSEAGNHRSALEGQGVLSPTSQGVRIPVISPSKGAPSVEVDFRVDFAANKDDMCAIGHSVERVVLHLAAVPP